MIDLKFEKGKSYVAKAGHEAVLLKINKGHLLFWHQGLDLDVCVHRHHHNGKYLVEDQNSNLDIIGEWEEPKVFDGYIEFDDLNTDIMHLACRQNKECTIEHLYSIPVKITIQNGKPSIMQVEE